MISWIASGIFLVQIIKLVLFIQHKLKSHRRKPKENNKNVNTQNNANWKPRNRRIIRNRTPLVHHTTNDV